MLDQVSRAVELIRIFCADAYSFDYLSISNSTLYNLWLGSLGSGE